MTYNKSNSQVLNKFLTREFRTDHNSAEVNWDKNPVHHLKNYSPITTRHDFRHFQTEQKLPNVLSWRDENTPEGHISKDPAILLPKLVPLLSTIDNRQENNDDKYLLIEKEGFRLNVAHGPTPLFVNTGRWRRRQIISETNNDNNNNCKLLPPAHRRTQFEVELGDDRYQHERRRALAAKAKLEKQITGIYPSGGPSSTEAISKELEQQQQYRKDLETRRAIKAEVRRELLKKMTSSHIPVRPDTDPGSLPDKIFQRKARASITDKMQSSDQLVHALTGMPNINQNPLRLEHILNCQRRERQYNILNGEQLTIQHVN